MRTKFNSWEEAEEFYENEDAKKYRRPKRDNLDADFEPTKPNKKYTKKRKTND